MPYMYMQQHAAMPSPSMSMAMNLSGMDRQTPGHSFIKDKIYQKQKILITVILPGTHCTDTVLFLICVCVCVCI